ncbi:aldo/keto reductase [Xanthobacter sp. YC-JY1]|uniref:aldo/keto reductase n=1 Tax=Xanthobacter sp. YC-JY1 TaxID=2419844 RepID=UPI001F451025|nr:aldo/keto reductase [Xanthobacter sp. YC-JY1]
MSCIAFGCASLGSRVSQADGERAIARALDRGVTWFDVAPPYGDGHAEQLLGKSLGARRKDVVICSKFGISRPNVSFAAQVLRPLARRAVSLVPGLRQVARRSRGTGENRGIAPSEIETWLDESLRQLGTDYLDVFAFHDPLPTSVASAETQAALQALVTKGKIRAISVAGPVAAIGAAASAGRQPDVVQFPDSPFDGAADAVRRLPWAREPLLATHGVIGSGALERIRGLDLAKRTRLEAFARRWGIATDRWEPESLMRYAFANNPTGVVLSSMFAERHLEANLAVAGWAPDQQFAKEFQEILAGGENDA